MEAHLLQHFQSLLLRIQFAWPSWQSKKDSLAVSCRQNQVLLLAFRVQDHLKVNYVVNLAKLILALPSIDLPSVYSMEFNGELPHLNGCHMLELVAIEAEIEDFDD